jgi:hypothetical protein
MKRKKKKDKLYEIEQKNECDELKKFIGERIKFFKKLRRTQFAGQKKQRKELREAIETLEFTLYLWEK